MSTSSVHTFINNNNNNNNNHHQQQQQQQQQQPQLIMQRQPAKYANISSTHIFVRFVIETSGTVYGTRNAQAIELTHEIGSNIRSTVLG